jgi:hypothetical protein
MRHTDLQLGRIFTFSLGPEGPFGACRAVRLQRGEAGLPLLDETLEREKICEAFEQPVELVGLDEQNLGDRWREW